MKTSTTLRRTALALGAAAVTATGFAPVAAQAQSYGYAPNTSYECQTAKGGRQLAGALLGGLAGMALGNNIGDDRSFHYGRRGRVVVSDNDTGATIGALVGAGIGAGIGGSTGPCNTQRQAYAPQPYAYEQAPTYNYDYRRAPPQQYYYDEYPQTYAPPAYDQGYASQNACTYVESAVRMPDGRTQTRMVQACPDSRGRYQIVD